MSPPVHQAADGRDLNDEGREPGLEGRALDLVDRSQQLVAVRGQQVVPELLPLLPGNEAENRRRAARGMQDASEHFDRGGLAGAIRTDERHDLAGVQAEIDPPHCFDLAVGWPPEGAQACAQPRRLVARLERLAEPFDLDRRGGHAHLGKIKKAASALLLAASNVFGVLGLLGYVPSTR